jgi:hypothetical protein
MAVLFTCLLHAGAGEKAGKFMRLPSFALAPAKPV